LPVVFRTIQFNAARPEQRHSLFRKQKGIMAMKDSQQSIAKRPDRCRKARSNLVRRLFQARDDPAKQRIWRWLIVIDDERLLSFGLTPEDIVLLRGSRGFGNFVNLLRMCALSLLSVPSPPGSWF
jgi:hypothetical protein